MSFIVRCPSQSEVKINAIRAALDELGIERFHLVGAKITSGRLWELMERDPGVLVFVINPPRGYGGGKSSMQ